MGHILALPTDLVGFDKRTLKWIKDHQKAFEDIKNIVTKEIILTYPNINEIFEIQTDVSEKRLSAVIS